jgi:hypothetical protein
MGDSFKSSALSHSLFKYGIGKFLRTGSIFCIVISYIQCVKSMKIVIN